MSRIAVVFDLPDEGPESYEKIKKELEAAGAVWPRGRLYHVAFPKDNGWFAMDVWESSRLFERFSSKFMTIVQGNWAHARPQIIALHNECARPTRLRAPQ